MKMINKMGQVVAAICLFGLASFASAAMISFDPTPATGNVGDAIVVDLIWDGSAGPEYLGDYDFDISWDASIVSLASVVQDPDSGVDSLGCGGGLCIDVGGAGLLNLFQVSLDSVVDLMTNQDALSNMFRIATLTFTGLADGQTNLVLASFGLGNENGLEHDPAVNLVNGQICVGPDGCRVASVPEPGTISIMLFGLLALGATRLLRRTQSI